MSKDWKHIELGRYVNELPKSRHLSGSSDVSGIYDFYVCSPKKQKSNFFDRDDTAVMLSTGGEFSVHLTKGRYAYSSDVWGLKGNDELSTEYLFRWFDLHKDRLNYRGFQGSGIQHLDKEYFRTRTLPLPAMEEQQKIAEILTSVDDVIENTQSQINKLEDLKKATMNELLTKGIGHTEFKETEIGRIPKTWEVKQLGGIFSLKNGLNTTNESFGEGVPFLSYKNVYEDQHLDETSFTERVTVTPQQVEAISVKFGDIFFTRTSETVDEIGLANVYLGRDIAAIFNGFCIRGRAVSKLIEPSFCRYLFRSEGVRLQIKRECKYTTRAGITGESLSRLRLPIPSLAEQSRICSVLTGIEKNISDIRRMVIQLRSKKNALMQDLLTGKVRVTVN